jgi:hypothetical protein
MTQLTEENIDALALQAAEMIGFKSGATVAYDVAGYGRCLRNPVDPASLPNWDLDTLGLAEETPQPAPSQAQFLDDPYRARLSGFRRRDNFGPDEIGALLREHAIAYNDGLGNGLYESLLINRKYGLNHVLEAPILGFKLPYVEADWSAFRQEYPRLLQRWVTELKEMEAIYHRPLVGPGEKLVVLWARHYPLDLFAQAYRQDPQAIAQEMEAKLGFAAPPVYPNTPAERADLARFWNYIQRKLSDLVIFEADSVRQALGPGTLVAANPHELPVLDLEGQAHAYEFPAVAIRPLLLADPVMLRHYIAYFTQLFNDLTGKAPLVSVRMNLSAASPQFVPTGRLIRSWYNQAVRHGAGAFYFWTRDYPPQAGAYDGPIPGNPVLSTLPQERWEASLQVLGQLSTRQRFIKPPAELAILVPVESALLHRAEWLRLFSLFSACSEARIHSRFLSDQQIGRSGIPASVRLLAAPVLEFLSEELRSRLETFLDRGGVLLTAGEPLYDREGRQEVSLAGSQMLDPAMFGIFNPDRPGEPEAMAQAAEQAARIVRRLDLDPQSWLFGITCDSLPPSSRTHLREPDPSVQFAPWQYEHGSEWIMPYL